MMMKYRVKQFYYQEPPMIQGHLSYFEPDTQWNLSGERNVNCYFVSEVVGELQGHADRERKN